MVQNLHTNIISLDQYNIQYKNVIVKGEGTMVMLKQPAPLSRDQSLDPLFPW